MTFNWDSVCVCVCVLTVICYSTVYLQFYSSISWDNFLSYNYRNTWYRQTVNKRYSRIFIFVIWNQWKEIVDVCWTNIKTLFQVWCTYYMYYMTQNQLLYIFVYKWIFFDRENGFPRRTYTHIIYPTSWRKDVFSHRWHTALWLRIHPIRARVGTKLSNRCLLIHYYSINNN